jgi:hypothetical protein
MDDDMDFAVDYRPSGSTPAGDPQCTDPSDPSEHF